MEGAGGRQLPRDEAFGCSTKKSSCYGPGKRNLNNRLFVPSGFKDFCWLHSQGRIPQTPRAEEPGVPRGDKQQSPCGRPQISLF